MKKDWEKASEEETVCFCLEVNKGTIVKAIQNGANTLQKIKDSTKACTGNECKSKNPSGKCCSSDIVELIQLFGTIKSDDDESSCDGCCE